VFTSPGHFDSSLACFSKTIAVCPALDIGQALAEHKLCFVAGGRREFSQAATGELKLQRLV
jgi:hypothetical protein